MYKVQLNKMERLQLINGKKIQRVWNAFKPQEYTTKTGIKRLKTYHPTKGWRDRNLDSISQGMTGLKHNQFSLTAKEE